MPERTVRDRLPTTTTVRQVAVAVSNLRQERERSASPRPTSSRSSLQSPSRTREKRQPPAIGVVARINDKDLQLKRSLLGAARVLTMDGIVESYTSAPENTNDSFDAIVKVVGRHEHSNILDNQSCELDSDRAITNTRLTWV
eukprot:CAMPEP_0172412816 /NCGR_PEP_ID=MMETSP1061-20121228/78102_1 /TAXON_ID=37318 /ORGANISM="Pseudo-nitzschia pungens, Strain cf. pungens" /LENGTH=141 /DNA_ID=CAMNT_0013149063 /DNA_START=201 /DNA_END=626 /DNA_ORIENTATION=+